MQIASDQRNGDSTTTDVTGLGFKVNIINVTVELPGQTRLGEELSELSPNSGSFRQRNRTNVPLIFDKYDLPISLKEAATEKKQGGQDRFC